MKIGPIQAHFDFMPVQFSPKPGFPVFDSMLHLFASASRKEKIAYVLGGATTALLLLSLVAYVFRSRVVTSAGSKPEVHLSNSADDPQGAIREAFENLPPPLFVEKIFILFERDGSSQVLFEDDGPFRREREFYKDNATKAVLVWVALDSECSKSIASAPLKCQSQQPTLIAVGNEMRCITITYEQVEKIRRKPELPRAILDMFKKNKFS